MEKGILANIIDFKKINNKLSNELRHNTYMMILVSFKVTMSSTSFFRRDAKVRRVDFPKFFINSTVNILRVMQNILRVVCEIKQQPECLTFVMIKYF